MKFLLRLVSAAALMSLLPVASAQIATGIQGTAHDFSGIPAPGLAGIQPTGLCTFCHTPHQASIQGLLWNRALSANNFSWTDPTTTAGTPYATFDGTTYNGPTTKCLSCHDGSVAVGDVGWFNAQAQTNLYGGFQITGPPYQIGGGGNMNGNHPVAMPFPWNNAVSTYNGSAQQAVVLASGWEADPQALGIVLYNDDGAGNISRGAVSGQTGIECGSCHDPHNGGNVQGPYFLYGELGGSGPDYICEKCHNKANL